MQNLSPSQPASRNEEIVAAYTTALTFQDYRASIRVHARAFNGVYQELKFVQDIEAGNAPLGECHILVLTEDFCIDSVLNVPLIARLVESSPDAQFRIASRNAHQKLASTFPGRGGVSRLPTAILFEPDGRVHGHWSERSRGDQQWMDEFLEHDPMPEIILDNGQPAPAVADWMERRLTAQWPFLKSTSWRFVRDELSAIAKGGL